MAYNYGAPPGSGYPGGQPPYGFPGSSGAPGMAPPGMDGAPGMQPYLPPGAQNPSFQPPPNMPNIDFSAPVIRLGVPDPHAGRPNAAGAADRLTSGHAGGRPDGRGSNNEPLGRDNRLGLGASHGGDGRNMDRERAALRESMLAMQPPTREEVARTIFIGGLGEGAPSDEAIEDILRCAGKLRRWTRARDADDELCKFGFAEYEDVESLEAADEVLPGLEIPVMGKSGKPVTEDDGTVKQMTLLVVVDEQSKSYIEEWKGKRGESDDARQFRIDGCKEDIRQVITTLTNSASTATNDMNGNHTGNADGDVTMGESGPPGGQEDATFDNIDEELSDIPAEMRPVVKAEIRAFRERSNQRDIDRLRREEELEAAERQRNVANSRISRLASPPLSNAATGPNGASNGVPVGPRDRAGIAGAPSGPKGYRGAQLPSDYANGVTFVGANGNSNGVGHEDDDADESDEELERRRKAKEDARMQDALAKAASKWRDRERLRKNAKDRESQRLEAEGEEARRRQEKALRFYADFDDDDDHARKPESDFYRDRSAWLRGRNAFRDAEERDEERDRIDEDRERADERRREAEARGLADDFLERTGLELDQRAAAAEPIAAKPGNLKISLGSAAARSKAGAASQAAGRRTLADVENVLEDDEDLDVALTGGVRARPELKPLTEAAPTSAASAGVAAAASSDLSDDERAAARQALAASMPATTAADLFEYPVRWNYLTPQILGDQLRPFVEDKVVEYLGVQEELLVDAVLDGMRDRKAPADIVADVEGALEEEAENLVRKAWRRMIFATEAEARGLS